MRVFCKNFRGNWHCCGCEFYTWDTVKWDASFILLYPFVFHFPRTFSNPSTVLCLADIQYFKIQEGLSLFLTHLFIIICERMILFTRWKLIWNGSNIFHNLSLFWRDYWGKSKHATLSWNVCVDIASPMKLINGMLVGFNGYLSSCTNSSSLSPLEHN